MKITEKIGLIFMFIGSTGSIINHIENDRLFIFISMGFFAVGGVLLLHKEPKSFTNHTKGKEVDGK